MWLIELKRLLKLNNSSLPLIQTPNEHNSLGVFYCGILAIKLATMKLHHLLVFLFITFFNYSSAQNNNAEEEAVYNAYIEQVKGMLSARGMTDDEIVDVIAQYKNNNIKSHLDLAKVIGKLYRSDRNIGVVFYFFNNDSLRIIFLQPGSLLEARRIAVTEKRLIEIAAQLNQSMNLYEQTASRMPQERGVTIRNTPTSKQINFDEAVIQASELLLPKNFDTSYRHLIIIPAFNISAIPFHLLRAKNDKRFLVEYCSYSIAPSVVDLIVLRYKMLKRHLSSQQFETIKQLFSLSPQQSYNEERKNNILHTLDSSRYKLSNTLFVSNPAYPTNGNYFFSDLQGAKKEVDDAKKYAKNYKLFEGKKAIKDSVLAALPKADLAYFATHGIANNENPMEKSFLVLSGNDAFLTAKDIMNTRLTKKPFPEMVVLSACQTGLGKFMNAGTVGLARSFLIAGSNHVIMSLWNVDDDATAFLMNRFLFHLQQKNTHLPTGALRLAVLDAMKQFPKPAKWASFTVFGVDY
jgi:CHAT domain-containing protein